MLNERAFKYLVGICFCLVLTLYGIVYSKTLQVDGHVSQGRSSRTCSHEQQLQCNTTIHVSLICTVQNELQQVERLVKSIMFHRQHPLHFHLVVDNTSVLILNVLFETWKLPDVTISYYPLQRKEIKTEVGNEISSLKKANNFDVNMLQEVLPQNVSKVIVLDPRVVLADDISELWYKFNLFYGAEALGLAEEQFSIFFNKSRNDGAVWKNNHHRFNTAIALLDLGKLRKKPWTTTIKTENENKSNLSNFIDLEKQSGLVYTLPCFWNLQLSEKMNPDVCYSQYRHKIKALFLNINYNAEKARLSVANRFPLLNSLVQTMADIDGEKIRRPSLKCKVMRNGGGVGKKHKGAKKSTNPCEQFHSSEKDVYRTHLFFLPFEYKPTSSYDVTIVIHLSFDRISMLEKICRYWKGPVSAAILINDFEIKSIISFVEESSVLKARKNIGYHLAFKKPDTKSYVINILRNIGLKHAVTDYVFLSDVDFVPMPGLYKYIIKFLSRAKGTDVHAYVVPAFETNLSEFEMPETKEALQKKLKDKSVTSFHYHSWESGHKPTNFGKWESADKPYDIKWAPKFEPYVVIRKKNCPLYDSRFSGYGFNKVTHIIELDALGFTFTVLPSGFLVHFPHAPNKEREEYIFKLSYRKCINFLKVDFLNKLLIKHGPTDKYDFLKFIW